MPGPSLVTRLVLLTHLNSACFSMLADRLAGWLAGWLHCLPVTLHADGVLWVLTGSSIKWFEPVGVLIGRFTR
jgi:hypothetical protein